MNVLQFVKLLAEDTSRHCPRIDDVMKLAKSGLSSKQFAEFMEAKLVETEVVSVAEWVQVYYAGVLCDTCTDELYSLLREEAHQAQNLIYTLARRQGVEIFRSDVDLPVTPTEAILRAQQNQANSGP